MKRIVVMEDDYHFAERDLEGWVRARGLDIVFVRPKTRVEFMRLFDTTDNLLLVNSLPGSRAIGGYTPEMMAQIAASGVRAVCHRGAGYDPVGDVEEWRRHGVAVANCPESPGPETANTAIYLLFGALRRFCAGQRSLRAGAFRGNLKRKEIFSPATTTLGILGMGRIGRMVRDRALPSGYKEILYHQRRALPAELAGPAQFVADLDEFLSRCDAVVVLAPYNASTYHLLDRRRLFEVVPKGVVIVNVARGPLIDEDALVDALNAGHVAAVGLDVYEHEPAVHPGLIAHDYAQLLPHAAALTEQVFRSFEQEYAEFVKTYVETGTVRNLVN